MPVNTDHLTGFVVGVGAAALGFYLYKRNQQQIDQWLRQQGINVPPSAKGSEGEMTLEELTRAKKRLEDLIAERELKAKEQAAAQPA